MVRVHPELLAAERLPGAPGRDDVWKRRYQEINSWEHYLVDIIAGIPFALCVQALVSPENRGLKLAHRAWIASSGLALTLGWMLLIRFETKWMLISPVVPWALAVFTVASVALLNGRLNDAEGPSEARRAVAAMDGVALTGDAPLAGQR